MSVAASVMRRNVVLALLKVVIWPGKCTGALSVDLGGWRWVHQSARLKFFALQETAVIQAVEDKIERGVDGAWLVSENVAFKELVSAALDEFLGDRFSRGAKLCGALIQHVQKFLVKHRP